MRPDKKRLKEQLVEAYAEKLDNLFDELDPQDELQLTEIEEAALKLRKEVGQTVTQAFVNEQSRTKKPDVICPNCEERMQNKGKKAKQISTRSGEVDVKRPYYYCPKCGSGFFPPR